MNIKDSFSTMTLTPVAGFFGTIATTITLMKDFWPSIVFLAIGVALLTYFLVLIKKESVIKDGVVKEWPLLASSCILLIIPSIGLVSQLLERNREVLWARYIEANNSLLVDELKMKADANDGPSQYALALKYYNDHNYEEASEYFQRAGNNGNGLGYLALYSMWAQGLGRQKDPHQAASYMIKARRIDYISDSLLRVEGIYDELNETERMMLDETRVELSRLESIWSEATHPYNLKVLNKYHDELQSLSLKGYIPATEYLYIEEYIKYLNGTRDINVTEELKRLARVLYQVNHIPTIPFERYQFFKFLYGDEDLHLNKNGGQIRDHNYPHLVYPFFEEESALKDHSVYSNDLLVAEYRLFRSQLDWCKSLLDGSERIITFLWGADNDYHKNYEDAKWMLEMNIMAIKERMTCLDVIDQVVEDFMIDQVY